jgi:uncharacterized protein (TIGR02145 family)
MNCSCPNCNFDIPSIANFCPNCGCKVEQIIKACPNPQCGRAELPSEARFCPDCGTQLNTSINSSNEFAGDFGTFVDERDGHIYKWVRIGAQVWMAENLAYFQDDSDSCHVFGGNPINLGKYGCMYTYVEAELACPEGWHLPTKDEWNTLFHSFNAQSGNVKALASTSGWTESDKQGSIGCIPEKNNLSGFNAKPGGFRAKDEDGNNSYKLNEYCGGWWAFTEEKETIKEKIARLDKIKIYSDGVYMEDENKYKDVDKRNCMLLFYNADKPLLREFNKHSEFSVRYIKD